MEVRFKEAQSLDLASLEPFRCFDDGTVRQRLDKRLQYQRDHAGFRRGKVGRVNSAKGFGFIQPDDGGKDAFVHISAVERAGLAHLVEGQKVQFDLVSDGRSGKMSADNLKIAG